MKSKPKTPPTPEPITVTNTIIQTIKLTIRGTEYKLTKEEAEQMRDALVKALPLHQNTAVHTQWLELYRKELEKGTPTTPWSDLSLGKSPVSSRKSTQDTNEPLHHLA